MHQAERKSRTEHRDRIDEIIRMGEMKNNRGLLKVTPLISTLTECLEYCWLVCFPGW